MSGTTGPDRVKYLFIWPAFLLVLLITLFPLIYALTVSFQAIRIAPPAPPRFVGFDNYADILASARFWGSIWTTAVIVFVSVALQYVVGFGLALTLHHNVPGAALYRVTFLLPMFLAPVGVALIARMLFHPVLGPVNELMSIFGAANIPFLTDPNLAVAVLITVDVWQWTPFVILLMLAGLQGLPQEVFETLPLGELASDVLQLEPGVAIPLRLQVQPHDFHAGFGVLRIDRAAEHALEHVAGNAACGDPHVPLIAARLDRQAADAGVHGRDIGDALHNGERSVGTGELDDAAPELVERRCGELPSGVGENRPALGFVLPEANPHKLLRLVVEHGAHVRIVDERAAESVVEHDDPRHGHLTRRGARLGWVVSNARELRQIAGQHAPVVELQRDGSPHGGVAGEDQGAGEQQAEGHPCIVVDRPSRSNTWPPHEPRCPPPVGASQSRR